jgi:hypothetical protein
MHEMHALEIAHAVPINFHRQVATDPVHHVV